MSLRIVIFIAFLISCSPSREDSGVSPNKFLTAVSLSPSITRQMLSLGLEDHLVGVTSFHPPLTRQIKVIGTIVNPNFEVIIALKPDIILLSLEDSATQKSSLLERSGIAMKKFPRNSDYNAIKKNYLQLSRIFSAEKLAAARLEQYDKILNQDNRSPSGFTAVFLVSVRPLVAVSGSSFIGDIVRLAGLKNIFENLAAPYPVVSAEEILSRSPDLIIISSNEGLKGGSNPLLETTMRSFAGRVITVPPDNISYYTPEDFVKSVHILSSAVKDH